MVDEMQHLDKDSSSSQCSSTGSRIRRQFPWLWSPTRSTTEAVTMTAREERRKLARLERTRSGAQQALKGLHFIRNYTDDLWDKVETRFNALAEDNLLRRERFGECIGRKRAEILAFSYRNG